MASTFFKSNGDLEQHSTRYNQPGDEFQNVSGGLNGKEPVRQRAKGNGRTHLTVISSTNEPKPVPKPSWVQLMVKDWIGGE